MKAHKKILILLCSTLIFLSCEKESPSPSPSSNNNNNNNPPAADAEISVTVTPSTTASNSFCEDDKEVIITLAASHLNSPYQYREAFDDGTGVSTDISCGFPNLKAATYTLTIEYRKNVAGATVYKKGDYSVVITEANATNAEIIEKAYTLLSTDICY